MAKDKADIWMPVFIGDYLSDTLHLTTEQHGAYLLLLFAYWKRRKPLPNDDAYLANVTKLSLDAWSNARAVLEEFFEISSSNAWVHARVEKELNDAVEKQTKSKEKAKKAAESRWNNAPSNAQAMLEPCPSPSPSPIKDKKTLSSGGDGQEKANANQKADRIPYDSVFEAYENVLCVYPYNRPRVKVKDDKRKSAIKKIWSKSDKTKTVDWWREYFEAATINEHWMKGDKHKGGSWDGANFDFLLRDDVFKRIVEGAV